MNTTVDTFLQMPIDLNGVMVPARSISNVFSRYVTNLVVHNDDPTFLLSLRGSATPIVFEGRYFLACCSHQLKGIEYDRVALLEEDGTHLVTSAGVRHFITKTDSDYSDLAIFDFSEPCREHPDLRRRFFPFRDIPPYAPNTDTIFLQVTGYPSSVQDYDVDEETKRLGFKKYKVICDLDGQPADPALMRLRAAEPLSIDPDGMSGGSAFTVQMVNGRPKAYLAGMTTRAGREHIHILKSGYIVSLLRAILDGRREA
ncbi:hypothetical protein [Ensifer sp. ENS08]|uniref:hypothetical protein n=1 Tax=Ensifer sp. ENS08 TaxID=2769273 RepID=UPI001782D2E0|nr:hypothetical protein [Ensifer sp. ENS08]MBD9573431.1 hypothetical protein [Ensifer sp. ENS08]